MAGKLHCPLFVPPEWQEEQNQLRRGRQFPVWKLQPIMNIQLMVQNKVLNSITNYGVYNSIK